MGGMVAQLLYKRHAPLLSGLVLCATARNVLGSPMEKLAALALPTAAAAIQWNPLLQPMSAEFLGMTLLGSVDDPATARWARAQMRRTTLATAISAVRAVCEFTSHTWIGEVDVPTAVVVTTRDRIVPASRQMKLARAIPGASVHEVDADHAVCVTAPQLFTPVLLQACWSVELAAPAAAGLTGHRRAPGTASERSPASPLRCRVLPRLTSRSGLSPALIHIRPQNLELNRGMDHMLPPEEDADLPAFCRALGVPGLADIHTHFLPPRMLRRVWEYFDRPGRWSA